MARRGGDFVRDIGLDISIDSWNHIDMAIELYFFETITFRMLTAEAAAVLPK